MGGQHKKRDPHWTPEIVRQRIRVGTLIHTLQQCARGKVELTVGRLKAIELLLAKSLPNLNALDVTLDGNITTNLISDQPRTIDQWQADAANYLVASTGPAKAIN